MQILELVILKPGFAGFKDVSSDFVLVKFLKEICLDVFRNGGRRG